MQKINLRDIVTEEFQHEIQESFAYATGFGVVFIDRDGNHIGKGSNFTKFCSYINEKEEGAYYCALSNRNAISIALRTEKPCIYVCHAGLINIEIPLIYKDYYVGAITAGQVLCSEMEYYPKDSIGSSTNWYENPKLAEYYKRIPILTAHQIEATTTALKNICNYILQNVAFIQAQQELAEHREKILKYEKRQIELRHELKLAQFNALQKQVTPHFIFNVINSVSRLISLEEYETAEKTLDAFAKMMRYSLSSVDEMVTLKREMEYIKNYLSIQKIRFADRLEYSIKCSEDAKNFRIPFFSLHPIVENSLKHGILGTTKSGNISIRCKNTKGYILIEITDNGQGMSKEKLDSLKAVLFSKEKKISSEHLGLSNSYNRMKIIFEEKLDFRIESKEGEGTKVTILIEETII